MRKTIIQNTIKSVFNAANLNGVGAVALSASMGSAIGVGVFLGAVTLGTVNKYRALSRTGNEVSAERSAVQKLIDDPTLTAKILMLAVGCNFADATYDSVTEGLEALPENLCETAMWGFGLLGDNALRRLDKVNFSTVTTEVKKAGSKVRDAFDAVATNPIVFYNLSSMSFAAVLLQKPELSSLEVGSASTVIGLCGLSVANSISKSIQAMNGTITADKINDGFSNVIGTVTAWGNSILSAYMGQNLAALAHGCFGLSALKSLYETREALKAKEVKLAP